MSRAFLARWLPQGLAGRFALLLAAALVAANAVAIALLASEHERLDRAAWEGRQIERIVTLVPALEALEPTLRRPVARDASSRFAQVSVDDEPFVVANTRTDALALAVAGRLTDALSGREVRIAPLAATPPSPPPKHHDGAASKWRERTGHAEVNSRPVRLDASGSPEPPPRRGHDARSGGPERWRNGRSLLISVALAGASDTASTAAWLNVVARGASPPRGGVPEGVLLLVLGLSLVAVLGVGLFFVRRLTRPLGAMATAARAAGRGDRSVRLPETGARELRDAAVAFNDMQSRIARFDAERTRTLAAVGHDLRTPITSLRIRAEMLDDTAREPMVRTLDEMAVMAEGLVAFARGEREVEEKTSVDLAALLARLGEERGVSVAIDSEARVDARPVALARALGNLVDNALRYGGSARLSLATGADEEGLACAVIDVEDAGPGIPAERLETVLEPFVRGEGSRSAATGGAGLGLSIARAIVRAHGGELRLENREEGGLRARATLPLEDHERRRRS